MTSEKRTIFLVDDNKSNLVTGGNTLSEVYRVFTFDSGLRMFKMLDKLSPDLILLDVEMPEMDGYEVLEKLKRDKRTKNVPVIFLTALSSAETELKGLALGAVDYVTKPFSPPLLLKRVELHLNLVDYRNNLEQKVKEQTREIVELKNAIIKTTAEIVEHRDSNTGYHVDRTQQYIKVLIDTMKKMDVYQEEMAGYDESLVLQSSLLHDVGKISIKDSILLKPGILELDEREEMKLHTTYGEKIISQIKTSDREFLELARVFAISHHEKWDGTGYPKGLRGEEIPLLGRIMAIADVYDALVTVRPYKKALTHSQAVEIIKDGNGKHFDPILTDVFLDSHDEFEKIATELAGSE